MKKRSGPESARSPGSAPRRRRRRRLLLAAAGSLVLLLGAIALFRDPLARLLLVRVLDSALGLEVRLEGLSISLDGEITIQGLEGVEPREWARIRSLRITGLKARLAPWRFLLNRLEGIRSATVSGAALEIDLGRPGAPAAAPPVESESLGTPFPWPQRLPEIDASFDRLSVLSGESRAELGGLRLRSGPKGGGSSLDLRARLDWKLGTRSGGGPLDLSLGYQGGIIEGLSAAVGDSRLLEDGRFDLSRLEGEMDLRIAGGGGVISLGGLGRKRIEARASLADLGLSDVLEASLGEESPVRGRLDLEIQANIPLEDPLGGTADLALSISSGDVRSVPLSRFQVIASLGNKIVQVSLLDVEGAGIALRSDGLCASLESLELREVFSSISGSLRLSSPDLREAALLLAGGPGPADLADGASLDSRLLMAGGEIFLDALSSRSPSFRLAIDDGRSAIDLREPSESSFSARGSLIVEDLSCSAPALGWDGAMPGGKIDLAFSLRGTIASLSAEAYLRGESLEVAGVPLGDMVGSLAVDPSRVRVERLSIVSEDGSPLRLALSGILRTSERNLEDVSLSLEGLDLRSRAAGLGEVASWLPAGSFQLAAEAQGPLYWPDLEISLLAERAGPPGKEGEVILSASKVEDRFDGSLESSIAQLELAACAGGAIEPGFARGDLEVRKLAAGRGGEEWRADPGARIRFDLGEGDLSLDPPLVLKDGRGRILVGVDSPEEEGKARGSRARFEASFPGKLPFLKDALGLEAMDLDLDLQAAFAGPILEAASDPVPRSLTLRLTAGEVNLPEAAARPRIRRIQANLDFHGTGPLPQADLALLLGEVSLEGIPGRPPLEEPLLGNLDLRASWDGEVARIGGLRGELAGFLLRGSGSARLEPDLRAVLAGQEVPIPGELSIRFTVDQENLSSLRSLAPPGLERIGGRLRLEGEVLGTGKSPRLGAAILLTDGTARLEGLPPISGLRARAILRDGDLQAESFRGELGGAPFEVTGGIRDLFGKPRLDLGISGENLLLVRTEAVKLRAKTSLWIEGEPGAPFAGGTLRITEGRVLEEIPILEFLGAITRKVGGLGGRRPAEKTAMASKASGLKLFSLREPPLKDLRLDIQVGTEESIEIRGNVFRGKARPEVALRGTGEVPYLSGKVYLDDFSFSLPATSVRVESGAVRFDEKNPLVPELNLTGSTRMRGYDIDVTVSGPFNEPTVVFTSSPPLPADQLAVLVTTGQPPASEGAPSSQEAALTVAKYLGADLLRKLFGRGDIEAGESILDRFEFDSGRNISRAGVETVEARFRLKQNLVSARDALYLTGERDEFEHYDIGLRIVFRGR